MFLPHRTLLISALAIILLLGSVVAQQTIVSKDGTMTYYCPTESTISAAYMSYCASAGLDGSALRNVLATTQYSSAPDSFQTDQGGFVLYCYYNDYACIYTAGGGEPLQLEGGSDGNCPQVSQTVPQPSPGVDYRKRSKGALDRRTDINLRYVCPRTSTEQRLYLRGDQISGSDGFSYTCDFNAPKGSQQCSYFVDEYGPPDFNNGPDSCPSTLCTAVAPVGGSGSNMRRGVFDETYDSIQKRQVKTGTLRRKSRR